MREYIEFHNPSAEQLTTDLEIDLRGLPKELAVSFRLTKLDTLRPLSESVSGVARISTAPPHEPPEALPSSPSLVERLLAFLLLILCWIGNLFRKLLGKPVRPCRKVRRKVVKLPPFEPQRFEAEPSALVEVRGIRLSPFGFGATLLEVKNTGNLAPGSEYRFEARQRIHGDERKARYLGGGTYLVVVDGERKRSPSLFAPSHDPNTPMDERERIERDGEKMRWVPLWSQELVEQRKKEGLPEAWQGGDGW